MAESQPFAEFLAVLSADSQQLQEDLKEAERVVRESAERMQKALNKVDASMKKAAKGSTLLTDALSIATPAIAGYVMASKNALSVIGRLAIKLGPQGLAVILAEGAVLVYAYRDAIASWIAKKGEAIGILTDYTTALKKADETQKKNEERLKKQEQSLERATQRRREAARLLGAQRTNNPEVMEDLRRRISHEKLVAAERDRGASEAAIDQLNKAFELDQKRVDMAREQARFKEQVAEWEKQSAEYTRKQVEHQEKMKRLRDSRVSAAASLLVSLGGANPSDFITDSGLRSVALLREEAERRQEAAAAIKPQAARKGAFGLAQITGRRSIVRGGEALGRQEITIQEEQKRVQADTRDIVREIKRLLDTWGQRLNNKANPTQPLLINSGVN